VTLELVPCPECGHPSPLTGGRLGDWVKVDCIAHGPAWAQVDMPAALTVPVPVLFPELEPEPEPELIITVDDGPGDGSETFDGRNAHAVDRGSLLFVRWCRVHGFTYHRVGFDPKVDRIPRFWELPEVVRLLPDFVVVMHGQPILVEVKGSPNLKQEEAETLGRREAWYGPRYRYAFCYRDRIALVGAETVRDLFNAATERGRFESDDKPFRRLELAEYWEWIEEEAAP